MNHFIIGFCTASLSLLLWPFIFDLNWSIGLFVAAVFLIIKIPLISGGLFAICVISVFMANVNLVQNHHLGNLTSPSFYQNHTQKQQIIGKIISFSQPHNEWLRADIEIIHPTQSFAWFKPIMRLSWSEPPTISVGQIWQFNIKKKPITSIANQGGFNQQKYFLSKHIIAKGNVVDATFLQNQYSYRDRISQQLIQYAKSQLGGEFLLALLVGDKQLISAEMWEKLRNTGTSHLISISGLHLSVVGLWAYVCFFFMLRNISPCQGLRNYYLSLTFSVTLVISYAYLAGFSIATQRAMIMILIVFISILSKRYIAPWERLLYAMFAVLIIDPLSPLSSGFWFSFCALAVILWVVAQQSIRQEILPLMALNDSNSDLNKRSKITNKLLTIKQKICLFLSLQWRLTLVLIIVQSLFFNGINLHSLWVNILMVPWFSFVVIPLALFGFFIWLFGFLLGSSWEICFSPVLMAINVFIDLVNASDYFPFNWITLSSIQQASIVIIGIGFILFRYIYYSSLVTKKNAVFFCFLVMFISTVFFIKNKSDIWKLHLLDVGQGLAVVIEKNNHGLIYDTGAAYGDFSYAQRVILPFLQHQGITHVDYLVVSHDDNDHAGGIHILTRAFPYAQVISDFIDNSITCRPQTINWQDLHLTILAPLHVEKGNNGSCVIQVSGNNQRVLLTGDIEAKIEKKLGIKYGDKLASNVLIVPHHGSKTSSTSTFINHISPEIALFAAGFNNQYGFPKSAIVKRYHDRNIKTLGVGNSGQITITFFENDWQVHTYRQDFAPFWYNQAFGFGQ